jgi:hypothetical protein
MWRHICPHTPLYKELHRRSFKLFAELFSKKLIQPDSIFEPQGVSVEPYLLPVDLLP